MSAKQKLKSFFKTKEGSDAAVELLRKFILPFAKKFQRLGVDDVIEAFFALNDRGFFYARTNRAFTMPGKYYIAGNRPVLGYGPRKIRDRQIMLIAVDRKESTARIETSINGKECNFLLEKFEFETIKDWLDVIV